jgi:hypothetical protein
LVLDIVFGMMERKMEKKITESMNKFGLKKRVKKITETNAHR